MRRIAAVGTILVLAALVLSSTVTVGGRLDRLDLRTTTSDTSHLSGPLVKVESFGLTAAGLIFDRVGYGVVVDPSGLVLVNAHVAAPDAPGLAAAYWDPSLTGFVVDTIVSVSPGAGQPLVETYSASLVAADGYLDVAIIRIDATYPDGTAIDPATLSLPSLSLADTSLIAPTSGVTYATYAEPSATSVVEGTEPGYAELTGIITGSLLDSRVGGGARAFATDLISPTNLSGGVAVDGTGALVGLPTWYPGTTTAPVNIINASLIAPVLDAARTGTEYVSPFTVVGTGEETLTHDTWAPALVQACADPRPAPMTVYPPGATEVAATFSYDAFTDGEDVLVIWFDPVQRSLIAANLIQWDGGTTGECYAFGISRSDGLPLADGEYGLQLGVGANLSFEATVQTTVGQPATGTIEVSGRIIDADTGQPIAGASFYVLDQGVDVQQWFESPNDDQIAAQATTGADGTYVTSPPLVPGVYPYVVTAFGYRAVGGDLDITQGGFLSDIALVPNE